MLKRNTTLTKISRGMQAAVGLGLVITLAASLTPTASQAQSATSYHPGVWCAITKLQQCPKGTYNYIYCTQMGWKYGTIQGKPAKIQCCVKWYCGKIR